MAKKKTKKKAVTKRTKAKRPAKAKRTTKAKRPTTAKKAAKVKRPKPKAKPKSTKTSRPAKRPAKKPAAAASKRKQPPALTCDWTVKDFQALFTNDPYSPTFSYTRTNPADCTVSVMYPGSLGGPLVNPVSDVATHDNGKADCSGTPVMPWTTFDTIPAGYQVRIDLMHNGVSQAHATTTIH